MSSQWKAEMDNYFKNLEMVVVEPSTTLQFCILCKSVWEEWTYDGRNFRKHPDMPTYGLMRTPCPDCK